MVHLPVSAPAERRRRAARDELDREHARGGVARDVDGAQPEFEDDPAGRVVTLDVWDSRFPPSSASLTPTSPP